MPDMGAPLDLLYSKGASQPGNKETDAATPVSAEQVQAGKWRKNKVTNVIHGAPGGFHHARLKSISELIPATGIIPKNILRQAHRQIQSLDPTPARLKNRIGLKKCSCLAKLQTIFLH